MLIESFVAKGGNIVKKREIRGETDFTPNIKLKRKDKWLKWRIFAF